MERKKNRDIDITKELHTKLNLIALDVLNEIQTSKSSKKPLDFEKLKPVLIAIKEIKDLVKINYKIKERDLSDLISIDEDLGNVNMLEEVFYEETKE